MIERRPYTFDRVVRIVFSICGLLIALYLLNVLKGVLLPFLMACLICYMLEPLVKWNQRVTHVKSRFLPVILTLLEAMLIVGMLCAGFFPYIANECGEMAEMVKAYARSKSRYLTSRRAYTVSSVTMWTGTRLRGCSRATNGVN